MEILNIFPPTDAQGFLLAGIQYIIRDTGTECGKYDVTLGPKGKKGLQRESRSIVS